MRISKINIKNSVRKKMLLWTNKNINHGSLSMKMKKQLYITNTPSYYLLCRGLIHKEN